MSPWLRRLFVWLVVLALPAQGMAGVARLHCASAPGAAAVVAAGAHAGAGAHRHGHDRAGHGHHHHGDTAVAAAPADDGGASPAPTVAHKCSACAACTVGAALPPARTVVPQPEPEPPTLRAAPLPAISFIASGPERPPRSSRA